MQPGGGGRDLDESRDPDDSRFAGWVGHADYFKRKSEMLRQQTANKTIGGAGQQSDIFVGKIIHVNGHTVPSRHELWALLATHGGQFERMLTSDVTHVIVSEMPDNKIQAWLRQPAANRKPHVLPTWLTESITAGRALQSHGYLHPRLRSGSQRSIADLPRSRTAPRAASLALPAATVAVALPASPAASAPLPTGRVEQMGRELRHSGNDPDFVRKYFKRSRLHHIGTSRGRYQKIVNDTCIRPMSLVSNVNAGESWRYTGSASRQGGSSSSGVGFGIGGDGGVGAVGSNGRVIMHIDMDCFFASVAVRSRPQLAGKAFVVCFPGENRMLRHNATIER